MDPLAAMDDAGLLAAQERGAEAFGIFYRRHVDAMIRFFARRGLDADDTADLVAETFAAALDARRAYRSEQGPALAWLYGIAHHKLADRGRRFARQESALARLGLDRIELTERDRDDFARVIADDAALQALEQLPPQQREAVRARIVEEQEYEEIGARFGLSETSARQRVSRGLRALRLHFREEGE